MEFMESNSENYTWNKSYQLDIPMIDKQHMRFFKLFDMLLTLNKDIENYNQFFDVIKELDEYTKLHFNSEEALMRKAKSPDYDFHISQHEIFTKKVEDFKLAYSYKNSLILDQMIVFMRKWFIMHISDVDRNYVETVKQYLAENDVAK